MSIPANEVPVVAAAVDAQAAPALPSDVPTLHNIVKSLMARLMAHSQTVQELMQANMQMRAALHSVSNDKGQLESMVLSMLEPAAPAANAPVVEAPAAEAPADANPVQA